VSYVSFVVNGLSRSPVDRGVSIVEFPQRVPQVPAVLFEFDPVSYISRNSAPFLIVHGVKDKQIPIEQSERLHDALQAKHVESQMLVLEDAAHDIPNKYLPAVSAAMLSFFRKHLG
jgi:fermentation-respiration switch protein FrsA (DUF1100 family)